MIKKLIFLLIPIVGFCQTSKFTLDDIESIKDVNSFKKVMMERGLLKWGEESVEGKNIDYTDNLGEGLNQITTKYIIEDDWTIIGFRNNKEGYNDEYDKLFDEVKSKCDYLEFDKIMNTELIKYDCGDGFKIGFGREPNLSFISKYPKE